MLFHFVRTILFALGMINACWADDSPTTGGFRSELWTMEYREKEEKPELQAPGEQEKDGSVIRNPAPIGDPVIDSGEQHRFYHETLPGEVNLTELQAETPFAEWQVDTAAIPDNVNQRFRKMPTAWQLSQSGTIGTAKTTKGPSMVTFFVAIVACVVVTGALFSGRE